MKNIRVCRSQTCLGFGAKKIMKKITKETGLKAGERSATMDLDYTGCLGMCSQAPNVAIGDEHIIMETSPKKIMEDIQKGGERIEEQIIDVDSFIEDSLADFPRKIKE
jgi:NADH:ubiquinone oxidoreductase subunit E